MRRPQPPAEGPFVGRSSELALLQRAMQSAAAGIGRIVFIGGEPGIGKTRLATAAASRAADLGLHPYWGKGLDDEGLPPYWVWRRILQSVVPAGGIGGDGVLRAGNFGQLPAGDRAVAAPGSPDPETERFRFYESVQSSLVSAAREQPLLLIIDDAQWAGEPSLRLLAFLANEIADTAVCLLVLYRDNELADNSALAAGLAAIARGGASHDIHLHGLTHQEVAHIVTQTTGRQPEPGVVRALATHTGGNPLFVTEVVRLAAQREGALAGSSHGFDLPDGVRGAVQARLQRISARCRNMLAYAALLSSDLHLQKLATVSGTSDRELLLDAVAEACRAGFLTEHEGRFEFSHPIVQETVAASVGLRERTRLHAAIADRLEAWYAERRFDHAAEIASHLSKAEAVRGAEKLADYARAAAENAMAAYSWPEAIRHYERVLQTSDPAREHQTNPQVLVGLARAHAFQGNRKQAGDLLRQAFATFQRRGQLEQAVEALDALYLCDQRLLAPDLQERGLQLVRGSSRAGAYLIAQYARHRAWNSGDMDGARKDIAHALELAERENDRWLQMRLRTEDALLLFQFSRWRDYLARVDDACRRAEESDDLNTAGYLHEYAGFAELAYGQLDAARTHAEGLQRLAEQVRSPTRRLRALHLAQAHQQFVGGWDRARELIHQGLALGATNSYLRGNLAVLEYRLGNHEEGAAQLRQLMPVSNPQRADERVALALAVISWDTGDDVGVRHARRIARAVADAKVPFHRYPAQLALGIVAVVERDVQLAERLLPPLSSDGLRVVHPWGVFSTERCIAGLHRLLGELDQAHVHLERAYSLCARGGFLPELAMISADWSDLLTLRSAEGDGPAAPRLDAEARQLAADLGMAPLAARLAARAATAGEAELAHTLTARETEVLRQVAAGLTNQEIGAALAISARTVSNHISAIFRKTGAGTRTEAAAFAYRHGLVSERLRERPRDRPRDPHGKDLP